MIEIRIHGRGGQGAVVASRILASAFHREGKYVQAFPQFGMERRGAPVAAFTRIDDKPIWLHCEIYEPDHLIILDPTLVGQIDITTGLKPEGVELPYKLKPGIGAKNNFIAAFQMVNEGIAKRVGAGRKRAEWSTEEYTAAIQLLPEVLNGLVREVKKVKKVQNAEG